MASTICCSRNAIASGSQLSKLWFGNHRWISNGYGCTMHLTCNGR
ncbi:hypothetical protein BMETH_2409_0 [methanotrophic bacterial endosymbiont of Bathymodiolus sp.]|nr:hypothetical protein BMETH_2409_0 [methanotrophic bacterial endosymbiont of Bathymodiolus sp.]